MRIGIQTIVDYNNYGNRLQNYALQRVLEQMGHEVVTLKNNFNNPYRPTQIPESKSVRILKSLKNGSFSKKVVKKVRLRNKNALINKHRDARFRAFEAFSSHYISESEESYGDNLKDSAELKSFDCFVIGSDQVWNYEFPRFSEFDFLPFVTQPKISYAASFGVDTIPDNLQDIYAENLIKIDALSVREEKGKQIINDLLPEEDVKVVLDPTLLLDNDEWKKLIQDRQRYDKKYVLTYFLDEPNVENKNYIKKIAKQNNLEIKRFANVFDEELWLADPAEFVNLFSQAEMVFTDSFHACVFAIIFEKYFEIFERNTKLKSMNSRIDTLMTNLHTGNRWHNSNSSLLELPDYNLINKHLEEQRKESYDFLESSLRECQKKMKVVDKNV
ncbi:MULTISPECIES: polysaccharide pyruvyl transferase family protein [Enterococcus]|uniref:polysaccharide pyruvyl transferase family protein n=1 Tax=Enterococcus TaxID=1350 RepID=UPI000F4E0F03|nr:polysaccharide pyruvyl transferase family protein [Enterococcus faecium]ROY76026.1 polysaccharide pyruvyl transferase family protein [Enterococcus faecium]ROZ09634.1 polysaccharide pyruvyl transferase family protein [Enterococcus faecium]ROZ21150.1 polysaccharide pyruvyl transferase family protein [Enterococcus faecium]